uniref:AlNc14C120G6636 protein n=1 Tax=Albugo laibachii Nc14 TaxID=890382 RepID=F0WJA9_9STRA|nr:AlNc14C120G6636 [Albugo laibachii Nc14]|eukprot:CCA21356.1 AlNc14C120G6636 [Albugo laibachii Nc14]
MKATVVNALLQSQLINTIPPSFYPFILMFTFATLYILALLLLFTIENGDCTTKICFDISNAFVSCSKVMPALVDSSWRHSGQ